MPLASAGPAELHLELCNGGVVHLYGDGINIEVTGEGRLVEDHHHSTIDMPIKFRLNVFDPDPRIVHDLQRAFDGLESVTVQLVERMRYLEPPEGLDVLYLPLAAAEQFGSKPLIHESQVLPTRNDRLPPFVVTGTCLAPDDPRGAVPETQILLSAVFNAIRSFNLSEHRKLERVGFWAYDLLPHLTAVELRQIMLDVVPELRADVRKASQSRCE